MSQLRQRRARRWMGRRALLGCVLAAMASAADAAVIYRWVDDEGRTHVSDMVPEKYRKSATRLDSGEHELSPQQRQEAEQRAARERTAASLRQAAPASAARASDASLPATARRPAQRVTDATDCALWWQIYRESQECFAPYRTARGGIKAEAFEHCNPVPSPEPKCGPHRD